MLNLRDDAHVTKGHLLSKLNFGKVDSESENALDKIFIQTNDFNIFLNHNTSLILGAKGAGKSALYRLFTTFEESARIMSGSRLDNTYIVSGTGFKDISNLDYSEIYTQMSEGNFDFQSAWKIYLAYKLVYELHDKHDITSGKNSHKLLLKAKKVEDFRVFGFLKSIIDFFIVDVPDIEQISFKDISIRLSKNTKIDVMEVLKEINSYLLAENKTVWVLLDKIDELFSDRYEIRKKCIEGLFLTLIDFLSRFPNIKLKIFLRTDIWSTLNFVNKVILLIKRFY